MKRTAYLLCVIILSTTAAVSCKKDAEEKEPVKCYECEVNNIDYTWFKVDRCTNQIDTVKFYDSNGLLLQHVCRPK